MEETRYQQALSWVTAWISARRPGTAVECTTRFYQDGLVDSFAILELIAEAEDAFTITFSQNDLASPAFQTVAGLARAIARPSGGDDTLAA